ncbi:hypothetical protein TUN199_11120 [Pyrenophora tritici-repentis]|nr:hypothetical protein TUN205_11098 [Pyrenophora tritici-repentis]KAI0616887.1 hypothetical protein TUN199_11120 [Pyrenophora tritici-repentis]
MALSSNRRAAAIPARASIPASTPRPVASVACWCGSTFKNHDELQRHGCRCAGYK